MAIPQSFIQELLSRVDVVDVDVVVVVDELVTGGCGSGSLQAEISTITAARLAAAPRARVRNPVFLLGFRVRVLRTRPGMTTSVNCTTLPP